MLGHRHAAADARLPQHGLPRALDPRRRRRAAGAPLGRRRTPATAARSATSSRVRARSPSRTTAASRSSSTPTARTSWSSTRSTASRRRIVRPLPGHLPEGVVWDRRRALRPGAQHARTSRRSRSSAADGGLSIVADGPAFKSLAADPMPADLRLGQKLFYSANSDDVPITQNHWVACASCHLEGRSDAASPGSSSRARATRRPTRGGMLDTGFLFRTADRSQVQDYWQTINLEQGGHFTPTTRASRAEAAPRRARRLRQLRDPRPRPADAAPTRPTVALGEQLFNDTTKTACTCCHSGPQSNGLGRGQPHARLSSGPDRSFTTWARA